MTNAPQPLATKAASAPSTILIVEDESIVAMDLELQLQNMGYEVCGVCDNGEEAIAQAWRLRPSIMLVDVVIKGDMDGIDAASVITRGLHIPVIFLTAYSDVKTIERAARAAPFGYLTKPFQIREVRAAIEVALYKSTLERRLRESEQWFASTLRCVGDGVVATDAQGIVRFVNPAAEALLGWPAEEAAGRDISEVLLLENAEGGPVETPVRRALRDGAAVGIEFGALLVARGGGKIPIDDSAAPIRDENGKTLGAVMVFRDVRNRLALEEKLRQSEARFRSAFDFAPVGMALISLDNRFLQVNEAISQLLGRSESELIGEDQARFSYPAEAENEQRKLREVLAGDMGAAQFEKRYRNGFGRDVWTLVSVSLLKNNGEPLCYLWQVHDLTQRKEAEFRLARLAHFDILTGLENRARLGEEIDRQIAMAHRTPKKFAVIFIDLDHFKQVNDSFGHEVGDQLLQAVAAKLKASVRETDTVARLGGDEFVILAPEIRTTQEALFVADKIRSEFVDPVYLGGHEIAVSLSLGVSLFPDDATDARTLLRFADSALYQAKSEGRNNLQFYRPELTAQAEQRLKLTGGLRFALERRQLALFYQPFVTLDEGAVAGAEALIRWNHPELGLLSPGAFIPFAEETGLITPIGVWVIEQACEEAASWPDKNSPMRVVTVNLSARQFKTGDLVGAVTKALSRSGLDPARLCLEITEQLLLQDTAHNLAVIAGLKKLGVGIAIDDFGVGYSSLSYIKHFRPTKLKIDRSLIRNIAPGSGDANIVRAVIGMAHSLNVTVITEGVETTAQQKFLQEEGSDMAQGFLYARPAPASEFRRILAEGLGYEKLVQGQRLLK